MANTSKLRLRLKFNFRSKGFEDEKIRTFAATLMQDVGINASDEMWKIVETKIARRLENDVLAEIAKMAQLYKQLIIGLSGERWGAKGKLTPASKFAEGADYSELSYELSSGPAGDWAKRGQAGISKYKKRNGDYYLPWKQRRVGHQLWFKHTGLLGSVMGAGKNWTKWFGPIAVTITRTSMSLDEYDRDANAQPTRTLQNSFKSKLNTGSLDTVGKGNLLKVQVANIRVEAMRNITPQMLPALANGDINDMPRDGRATGLIGLLPPQIAQHIAGRSDFVPYRHTLEPFLGFVLTRAIPNAVLRRIQDGLGKNIRHFNDTNGRDEKHAGDTSGL